MFPEKKSAHLQFSADKKTCRVIFANGSKSIDEYDSLEELHYDLHDMVKSKKISQEEHDEIFDQSFSGDMHQDEVAVMEEHIRNGELKPSLCFSRKFCTLPHHQLN